MRKLLALVLILAFASSSGIAQNGNIAEIEQAGDQNDADINQTKLGTPNSGTINQQGSGNDADVGQYGAYNLASVDQVGDNTAKITQGVMAEGVQSESEIGSSFYSSAAIAQKGSYNNANINQKGGFNLAGISSESTSIQGEPSAVSSDSEIGIGSTGIYQSGKWNNATINQYGSFNRADITHIGNGNKTTITQTGFGGEDIVDSAPLAQ